MFFDDTRVIVTDHAHPLYGREGTVRECRGGHGPDPILIVTVPGRGRHEFRPHQLAELD